MRSWERMFYTNTRSPVKPGELVCGSAACQLVFNHVDDLVEAGVTKAQSPGESLCAQDVHHGGRAPSLTG
jgi:hypothetical protein